MTEYALIDPQGQIARRSSSVDPLTTSMRLGWRWLKVIVEGNGPVGPNQIKEGPFTTIGEGQVTDEYVIRDKSPQELDQDKAQQVESMDLAILRILFAHENRIRVLESRQQVTVEQFKAAVKDLL